MAEDSGETRRTTDHDTIREWAEARDAHPATVADTGSAEDPGVLRFDFESEAQSASDSRTESGEGDEEDDEDLERISWDAFFEAFEENDLAMLYQEELESGEQSRFVKFVSREE